jgi:hypothetical protein
VLIPSHRELLRSKAVVVSVSNSHFGKITAPSKGTRNWCNFHIESGQRDVPKSHQVAASVPTAGLASFRQIIFFLVC